MTERNTPSAAFEEQTSMVERRQQPEDRASKKRRIGSLGVVAMLTLISLSVGLCYYGYQQIQRQQTINQVLRDQLITLTQDQLHTKQQLEISLQQQSQLSNTADRQQTLFTRQLNELQEKVAAVFDGDIKVWQLAQTDFLVNIAGRKLWADQDVTTALALLKSADATLADMNDPNLIEIRRAITEDISALSALNQIDFYGIILKINQLSNQIDNLRLADNSTDGPPMDGNSNEVSSSLGEWRQNLSKSWHNFMSSFITIRRRDSSSEPLLAPNQGIYLRENIRLRLLIAAQAVPRHQDEMYKQSLEISSTWIRAYFDVNDPSTKAFLEELDILSQQSISMNVPDQLRSQPLLEKLMRTQAPNRLTQPPTASREG